MENKSRFKSQSFTQQFCDMKLFSLWKPQFSHLHNIEYYEKMLYLCMTLLVYYLQQPHTSANCIMIISMGISTGVVKCLCFLCACGLKSDNFGDGGHQKNKTL